MKIKINLFTAGLICILAFLAVPGGAHADETVTDVIRTSDGTEFTIELTEYETVNLVCDEFGLMIQFFPSGEPYFSINNTPHSYNWSNGVIYITSVIYDDFRDHPVDLTLLPEAYRNLWENLMWLSGDLVDNDDFWDVMQEYQYYPNETYDEFVEIFKSDLEATRDGFTHPNINTDFIRIELELGLSSIENVPCRTWHIEGMEEMDIDILSDFDSPPDLIDIIRTGYHLQQKWLIRIDSVNETCSLSMIENELTTDYSEQTLLDYLDLAQLEITRFNSMLPLLNEIETLQYLDDFESVSDRCLFAFENYDIVIAPSENNAEEVE